MSRKKRKSTIVDYSDLVLEAIHQRTASEVSALEKQIQDLRAEIELKNERIIELEKRVTELEQENALLREMLERLKKVSGKSLTVPSRDKEAELSGYSTGKLLVEWLKRKYRL